MNKLQKNLSLWGALLSLVLALAVRPALAQNTSPQTSDNQTDTEKKKSQKSKKDKSADSQTGQTSTGASTSAGGSSSKPNAGSKSESSPVSSSEIASAQASGKVWVNLDSGIYHKGGQYYGHTKNGKFMTEAEAQKAGYREAKNDAKK